MSNWTQEIKHLANLLPNSKVNIGRLNELLIGSDKTKIAVFGKFNHGKSTLLNTILGYEHFSVADKRETVTVSEIEHDGRIWIDTPGLDADTSGNDDKLAIEAIFEKADIVCLVHNVKAGELDKSEIDTYRQLMASGSYHQSKFVLVLTQIDQVNLEDLDHIKDVISGQIPDITLNCVSAKRYQRGINEGKDGFIKASGILALLNTLEAAEKNVGSIRKKEAIKLINKIKAELNKNSRNIEKELGDTQHYIRETHFNFNDDLTNARKKYDDYQSSLS